MLSLREAELLDIYIHPHVLTIQENNTPLPNQAIPPITRIKQVSGDVLVHAVRIIMDGSLSQHGNLSPSKSWLGLTPKVHMGRNVLCYDKGLPYS